MALNDSTRGQIADALSLLTRRRTATNDRAEKAAINQAIDALNGQLQDLDQAELLQAAQIASAAAGELEKVVAAARIGAFDSFVSDLQGVIGRLQGEQGDTRA